MPKQTRDRVIAYTALSALGIFLFFIRLGAPSLWDVDEGNNAEASREMLESGDWVVPTFNFQLRPDKPILIYWLQATAFRHFGISEWAARLPCALASLLCLLVTYEFGRSLYDHLAGLMAATILGSSILFCAAGHFANPDALLNAFTVMTLWAAWQLLQHDAWRWYVLAGASSGLAVLAKGPVGLALPGLVFGLYVALQRQTSWVNRGRLSIAVAVFCVAVLPWYIWVGVQTKFEFWRGFLLTHNWGRFRSTMEGHQGPFYYYFLALLPGFAPWSALLGPTLWRAIRRAYARSTDVGSSVEESVAVDRFLLCWIATYLVFFSCSATKLPNYVLPVYPPLALLTARLLQSVERSQQCLPLRYLRFSLSGFLFIGLVFIGGIWLVSGRLAVPVGRIQLFPEIERFWVIGFVPLACGAGTWWWLQRDQRRNAVGCVLAGAVLFTSLVAGWGATAMEPYKAPRGLVQSCAAGQLEREVRMACFNYFQPSLVFYCQREVTRVNDAVDALKFLRSPLESYLFVPRSSWVLLRGQCPASCQSIGCRHDFYQREDILIVSNKGVPPSSRLAANIRK